MPLPPLRHPILVWMLHLQILDMLPLHRLDLLHCHPGLVMLLGLHDGDALVVVVNPDAEGDFDVALSDDVFVESVEYLAGGGKGSSGVVRWWWWLGMCGGGRGRSGSMACDLVDGFVVVHDDVGWAAIVGVGSVVVGVAAGRAGLIGNMLHHKLRLRHLPHFNASLSLGTRRHRRSIARNPKPSGTRRAIKAVTSISIDPRARAGFSERDGGAAFGAAVGWISPSRGASAADASSSASASASSATTRHEAGRARNATVTVTVTVTKQ